MKRQVLVAFLATGMAFAANANSVRNSSAGSSAVVAGSVGAGSTTVSMVSGSVIVSGEVSLQGLEAFKDYIVDSIQDPVGASAGSSRAVKGSVSLLFTTSGNLIIAVVDGSVAFLKNPVESTSNSSRSISNTIDYLFDESGNLSAASSAALGLIYEEDMELMGDGAMTIKGASGDSFAVIAESAGSVSGFFVESAKGSWKVSKLSAQDVSTSLKALSAVPGEAYETVKNDADLGKH